jgi:WD40 repeat protein
MCDLTFSSDGKWMATGGWGFNVGLWPLADRYCRVLRAHDGNVKSSAFSPDGSRYFTPGETDGKVLSRDLSGGAGREPTLLFEAPRGSFGHLAVDPLGCFLLCTFWELGAFLIPLDGGEPIAVENPPTGQVVLDRTGRFAASIPGPVEPTVVIVDLEENESWTLDGPGDGHVSGWAFDLEGRLLVERGGVLSRWDPASGTTDVLLNREPSMVITEGAVAEGLNSIRVFDDGRIFVGGDHRLILNPDDGTRIDLPVVHQQRSIIAFDPAGTVVASARNDGAIRVGQILSEEPHLLLGHDQAYAYPEVSPDRKWIASTGQDGTIRLWPMPDLSRRPFHTLPHDELMKTLEALTNMRVIPNPRSLTGYMLSSDASAWRGWAEVPEW